MSVYDNAFRAVVGEEGGFTANPADPGNWTGGACGSGRCVGTKYGISAAAYPTLDIAALTLDDAQTIYRRDYWDKMQGDNLPPALALLVFDAAVNSGVSRAVRWLQSAIGVKADGVLGAVSLAAARNSAGHGAAVLAEFQAQRLMFLAGLPTWRTFGLGWARRLCRMQYEALRVGEAN
jgi:lysozyme family protein